MHEQNRRHPTTGLEVPFETVHVTMYNILCLWSSGGVVFRQMFRSHLMKLPETMYYFTVGFSRFF